MIFLFKETLIFQNFYFLYLWGRETERGGDRSRESVPIWFTSQTCAMVPGCPAMLRRAPSRTTMGMSETVPPVPSSETRARNQFQVLRCEMEAAECLGKSTAPHCPIYQFLMLKNPNDCSMHKEKVRIKKMINFKNHLL